MHVALKSLNKHTKRQQHIEQNKYLHNTIKKITHKMLNKEFLKLAKTHHYIFLAGAYYKCTKAVFSYLNKKSVF